MSDLIDREAMLKHIEKTRHGALMMDDIREASIVMTGMYMLEEAVRNQPSAQPEIIRCKDCKYGELDDDDRWYCRSLGCQVGEADGSGFCADAERRTDD